ncbi:MAG: DUF3239 domain-containing protein [Planctomycetota bacterium]|nr:DUF3239 domain-containing protein [Planctomycetota bacterium]
MERSILPEKVDTTSFATNPGNVKVDWNTFYQTYPAKFVLGTTFIGLAVLVFAIERITGWYPAWVSLIVVLIGYLDIARVRQRISQWMAHGDTCPGVVIDVEQSLIAVWADMTTDPFECSVPALRIAKVPLKQTTGYPFEVGQRVPTICTYGGIADRHYWTDLEPIPVGTATREPELVMRKMVSIPEEEWDALVTGLELLEPPYEPGLYFLDDLRGSARDE